ncbi:hypothetical protein V6Z11_A10G279000 [Gossypium hirsutum]
MGSKLKGIKLNCKLSHSLSLALWSESKSGNRAAVNHRRRPPHVVAGTPKIPFFGRFKNQEQLGAVDVTWW